MVAAFKVIFVLLFLSFQSISGDDDEQPSDNDVNGHGLEKLLNRIKSVEEKFSQLESRLKNCQCFGHVIDFVPESDSDIDCPTGWSRVDRTCLRFFDEPKTWESARKQCQSEGGDLASLNSNSESDLAVELIFKSEPSDSQRNVSSWIGLTDDKEERKFRWSDNAEPKFKNWGNAENDDDKAHLLNCVIIQQRPLGKWLPVGCQESHPFLCKGDVKPKNEARIKSSDEKIKKHTDLPSLYTIIEEISTDSGSPTPTGDEKREWDCQAGKDCQGNDLLHGGWAGTNKEKCQEDCDKRRSECHAIEMNLESKRCYLKNKDCSDKELDDMRGNNVFYCRPKGNARTSTDSFSTTGDWQESTVSLSGTASTVDHKNWNCQKKKDCHGYDLEETRWQGHQNGTCFEDCENRQSECLGIVMDYDTKICYLKNKDCSDKELRDVKGRELHYCRPKSDGSQKTNTDSFSTNDWLESSVSLTGTPSTVDQKNWSCQKKKDCQGHDLEETRWQGHRNSTCFEDCDNRRSECLGIVMDYDTKSCHLKNKDCSDKDLLDVKTKELYYCRRK